MSALLADKVAVIYGGSGAIGAASDRAGAMTGAIANLTCGSLTD